VRRAHETTTWTTSVCTGSLLLGRTGALQGERATSHWAVREQLRNFGAEPVAERVVVEGTRAERRSRTLGQLYRIGA
jgi:putative intracellular protease/amidase